MSETSLEEAQKSVDIAIASAERTDKGIKYPEGTDPLVQLAANSEFRRRDTQASHTKLSQELKQHEHASVTIQQLYLKDATLKLTPDDVERLEQLKLADPEEWRLEVNKLEQQDKVKVKEHLDQTVLDAHKTVYSDITKHEYAQAWEDFGKTHPDSNLDAKTVDTIVPASITKKFEAGELTVQEYISNCHNWSTQYTAPSVQVPNDIDLSKVSGTTTPSSVPKSEETAFSNDYKKVVY